MKKILIFPSRTRYSDMGVLIFRIKSSSKIGASFGVLRNSGITRKNCHRKNGKAYEPLC